MSESKPNRIGPQAAAAIAGVTSVALGCSAAEDAINSLVEDNITLEDTIGQANDVNLEIDDPSASPLAGEQVLFFFENDNEVRARVPMVSSEDSVNVASIESDVGLNSSTLFARVTFDNGPLAGHFLEARLDFETQSLSGVASYTLQFNGETVGMESESF